MRADNDIDADSVQECGDGACDMEDEEGYDLEAELGEEKKDDTSANNISIPPQIGTVIGPPKLPVDREWLQKLLHKHSSLEGVAYDSALAQTHLRAYVLAPMVDQSDLPFRLQCRKYGTNLCYTPMIHAKLFATAPVYRQKFCPQALPSDRPLVAQLCGSNVEYMVYTALTVAPYVDAIDINCGCPQSIAKRGMYGAFLLEQEEILLTVVRHLLAHLDIPLTVKVRLLPPHDDMDDDDAAMGVSAGSNPTTLPEQRRVLRDLSLQRSMALYTRLVDAGVHMLTVHGRTRFHKGVGTGAADWDAIRHVVDTLGSVIPILANGSISNQENVRECLLQTGADGIMSSEAILEYPPLFTGLARSDEQAYARSASGASEPPETNTTLAISEPPRVGRLDLAWEFLALAARYPPYQNGQGSGVKCCKVHVHRFLHADLQLASNSDLRTLLVNATSMDQLIEAVTILTERRDTVSHCVPDEELSWYFRHRHLSRDCFGITVNHGAPASGDSNVPMSLLQARMDHERSVKRVELIDDAADCFASLFDEG